MGAVKEPPIFIGFSAATGLLGGMLGAAIRAFTGGTVNHAFLVYFDRHWGAWLTVGANANGLTIMTIPEFCKTRKIKFLFSTIGFSLWDGLRAHVGDLDRGYNYGGLIGMANVEIVKKLRGRLGDNFLSQRGKLFCSQWDAEIIKAAMLNKPLVRPAPIPFLAGVRDDEVDPSALCTAIQARPDAFKSEVVGQVFVPLMLAAA